MNPSTKFGYLRSSSQMKSTSPFTTGVGTKISTNFFENIDKFFWKYRQIFQKISTKFSKNIDKIFKKYRQNFQKISTIFSQI